MTAIGQDACEDCLALLSRAWLESQNRNFEVAKRALAASILAARALPGLYRPGFGAALAYSSLLVQFRQSPSEVTPELRSRAARLLGGCEAFDSIELFQILMFDLLSQLGEHRRAIPFGERVLGSAVQSNDAIKTADWLWKMGGCYSRIGLLDHAAIAYRASLRIFRGEPKDPRLPVVLVALGNAIRKSAPAEAEVLYREAAGIWEQKGQLESATPAWSNLGIICSDDGRFQEAVEYYERVRRVREASPGTPPARIATLYNNVASCYRKMGRFQEAHQAIERAIELLRKVGTLTPQNAIPYAHCLGTKGMILSDERRDAESLEWFRKARALFESQPSPNFRNIIEEFEHEAAALRRIGRCDEADAVERQIAAVRKSAAEIPVRDQEAGLSVDLPDGAVFIEFDGGLRMNSGGAEIARLGIRLSAMLEGHNLGHWHGLIQIPESTTLIFYGPDAEALYAAVQPELRADTLCGGARITIRQGAREREVVSGRRIVN